MEKLCSPIIGVVGFYSKKNLNKVISIRASISSVWQNIYTRSYFVHVTRLEKVLFRSGLTQKLVQTWLEEFHRMLFKCSENSGN